MVDAAEKLEVPRFSMEERERRWRRVRELMDRDGIDVLLAPPNTGHWDHFQANVRYLTGLGGNCVEAAAIFPREGEVTGIVVSVPPLEVHLGSQDWVTDVRDCGRYFGDAMVERLRELGAERSRIGVAGLAYATRMPEGIIHHGTYMKVRDAFPDADIVDATFLMEEAKYVKSQEELDFLQKANDIVEMAIDTMVREAHPGVRENVVYGRMIATMVEQGGELPTMLQWMAGPDPGGLQFQPSARKLQAGDIISNEIEARWAGYVAQGVQPVVLGKLPAEYGEMFRVQQDALDRCYELLRPGHTVADLIGAAERAAVGTKYRCVITMHGRGLGDDAPISYQGVQDDVMRNWPIEENAAFIVKPLVTTEDRSKRVYWGDTVVATTGGARRMGVRPREFIQVR